MSNLKLISHRGNLNGKDPLRENVPCCVQEVLNKGVDCEVDIWHDGINLFLGHDIPEHVVFLDWVLQDGLWCHAKNLKALYYLLEKNVHCFWHENDSFTLTSLGYIWTFPNKNVGKKSIIVDNNLDWRDKNYSCFGVCTDWVF